MLNRRAFCMAAGLGMLAAAVPGCRSAAIGPERRDRPPNLVLIYIDDQGYGDLGCFGAKGFETPILDNMARDGMKFTNFHTTQAVCSASRASLLTGCYANRVGIRGALGPNSKVGLNPEEETLAEVLKQRGYATGIFGKWHLGHHKPFLPLQHGFDEYLGVPYSNDMWPVDYDGKSLKGDDKGSKPWKAKYPELPLIDGNEQVAEIRTLDDQGTLTTRYTERAVSFIERNHDQPFFLYMPHSMVHVPLGVSDKFKGKSEQGMYGDVMMEIDWSVGEILATLDRHDLARDTMVVFTSDNGPWLNYGNHAGSTGGLREGKGTSWEGGKRVPCLMRWPGVIPAGTECDRLAATIDILPTFAALASAPLPKKKIDGVDIRPLLRDDTGPSPRDHLCYYYPQGGKFDQLQAVTDGRWKLHFPHDHRSYVGVEPRNDGWPGPYAKGHTDLALFDLENDLFEQHDVKDEHPAIVERLKNQAEITRKALGDKDQAGEEARPAGTI